MVIELNTRNNQLLSALIQAESVVTALSERGITVLSVMMRDNRPRIHIARHAYCEQLIRDGQAAYLHFGKGRQGPLKQGVFNQDGCQVYWSESLH
ncbi:MULTISPECIES: hypothetical protein [Xenorhabdus]|uniref:hypothetical protein n=1 Tax=Xenorhabdus TaxID=626 RepID=UPI00064A0593|nr:MULTISPECIES: hypothetical protein [Xenorhabdus]KLU14793.1 hypothetical protein AAY47_14300 [Xenorhabdus griffiniae]KOP33267.1 hypothetical protein AFK69_10875 [Xenorhabdus sp. GDc328]